MHACVQGMQCSLNRSNPGLPLLVLTAPGDLSPGVLQAAHACGQVLQVEDVRVDSSSTYEDGRQVSVSGRPGWLESSRQEAARWSCQAEAGEGL